jgi:hypothetical protein
MFLSLFCILTRWGYTDIAWGVQAWIGVYRQEYSTICRDSTFYYYTVLVKSVQNTEQR